MAAGEGEGEASVRLRVAGVRLGLRVDVGARKLPRPSDIARHVNVFQVHNLHGMDLGDGDGTYATDEARQNDASSQCHGTYKMACAMKFYD